MSLHASVGAERSAADSTRALSIAPVLASDERSNGAGRAKLTTRATTRRATRSSGVRTSAANGHHTTSAVPSVRLPGAGGGVGVGDGEGFGLSHGGVGLGEFGGEGAAHE